MKMSFWFTTVLLMSLINKAECGIEVPVSCFGTTVVKSANFDVQQIAGQSQFITMANDIDSFSSTGAFNAAYRLRTLSVSTKDGIVACIQSDLQDYHSRHLTFLLHGSASFCETQDSMTIKSGEWIQQIQYGFAEYNLVLMKVKTNNGVEKFFGDRSFEQYISWQTQEFYPDYVMVGFVSTTHQLYGINKINEITLDTFCSLEYEEGGSDNSIGMYVGLGLMLCLCIPLTYCCIKSYRQQKIIEEEKLQAFREKNKREAELRARGIDPAQVQNTESIDDYSEDRGNDRTQPLPPQDLTVEDYNDHTMAQGIPVNGYPHQANQQPQYYGQNQVHPQAIYGEQAHSQPVFMSTNYSTKSKLKSQQRVPISPVPAPAKFEMRKNEKELI